MFTLRQSTSCCTGPKKCEECHKGAPYQSDNFRYHEAELNRIRIKGGKVTVVRQPKRSSAAGRDSA
ncbi:MAG: hypothetical protein QOH35_2826 [Acidobacteriaceae bacterium]|jgi:hypothetical protein|nr:hypothetical protein [Acidobacteriaceae bacterium]MEA2541460.1 hypothetical protein [Acidobacteriaceae bacterium]MEA3006613.1 hypothetical protein [Acidobacteriaceae bacterium]